MQTLFCFLPFSICFINAVVSHDHEINQEEFKFQPERDVKFIFKTRSDPNGQAFTFENRNTLRSKMIDAEKPLRIIIHDWMKEASSPMVTNLTEAYFQTQDVTLMIVDWSFLAKKYYLLARQSINKVANVTGYFLHHLNERNMINMSSIYLIGHGMGGHIIGLIGKKIQELKLEKIPMIFALDPAGSLFSLGEKDSRLDKDDAKFVVVLHTSTRLGFTEPLGHVDFYANYGFSQPGCGVDLLKTCAHDRAYMYLAEAVLNKSYENEIWALKCNSKYEDIEDDNNNNVKGNLTQVSTKNLCQQRDDGEILRLTSMCSESYKF